MRKLIVSLSMAAALVLPASVVSAQNSPTQRFITKAIQGNIAEAHLGELAQKNGESTEVKAYGQSLQSEHSAANEAATAVATAIGVTPPREPTKKQEATYDRLAKLSGAAFDRAFVKHMVDDHRKEIAEYRNASKMKDARAREYATDTLPILQKHLETAQTLAKDLRKR